MCLWQAEIFHSGNDRCGAEILVRPIVSNGYTRRAVFGVIRAQNVGENFAVIPIKYPVDGLIIKGIGVIAWVVNRHRRLSRKPIAGNSGRWNCECAYCHFGMVCGLAGFHLAADRLIGKVNG